VLVKGRAHSLKIKSFKFDSLNFFIKPDPLIDPLGPGIRDRCLTLLKNSRWTSFHFFLSILSVTQVVNDYLALLVSRMQRNKQFNKVSKRSINKVINVLSLSLLLIKLVSILILQQSRFFVDFLELI
jgi:hypothetical protein